MIAVLLSSLLPAAFLCLRFRFKPPKLFIISIGNEAVKRALAKGTRSMKPWPWPSAFLGCCGNSMHEATGASACSHAKQSVDGHALFSEGASHESSASYSAVDIKEIRVAVEHPIRARNLDKADMEYKGRQYTKAKQAALGEEVRRKIASKSLRKEQDIGETDESNPPQQVILHEEDCCKLDVAAANNEDHRCQNADIGRMEEHEANTLSLSLQNDRSWNDVPHRGRISVSADSSLSALSTKIGVTVPESSEMSWGHSYTYEELKEATNHFNDANVLGSGNHAIVYRGVDSNGIHIVLKNLLNNRGQAEKEFKSEVEAIGRIRHKHLVQLIGYCTGGSERILVYEFIDNGNLEQWLHGPLGKSSPLSWDIRMKIIIGTAKGLAYLHEGLEPKVVHRDVKPSNILLDNQWNAKVSDFGFAKLMQTGKDHVATRVMGTFGYVAPEYVSTGMLTEKSDIFSYGVLLMELMTGRVPFDRNRPVGEVHLVEWLKSMVRSRQSEDVADPNMGVKPSMRSLKRALLVALRCVDPDASKRPKMSYVVHMLESVNNNPVCQEPKIAEVYCGRGTKQLPTIVQRHKVFTIPAFVLPQKTTVNDKLDQKVPIYDWPVHENGGFMDNIDRKATWKRER